MFPVLSLIDNKVFVIDLSAIVIYFRYRAQLGKSVQEIKEMHE